MKTEIKIHQTTLPQSVLDKLARRRGQYSDIETVFHAICFDNDCWLGVAGDGDNASYEWFVSTPKEFKASDCGYGDSLIALRDVINQEIK